MKKLYKRTKEELQAIELFMEDYDLNGDVECYMISKKMFDEIKEDDKRTR